MSYVLKEHLANKSNYGSKRALSTIKYIVIHYTSNDGDTDENNGKYFANNVVNASAHYFVDDDSVTRSVPDNYVAWSVGGNKYSNCASTGGGKFYGIATNNNTLSIEICDDVKNGVVYPSAATIENVIAFTKAKMNEYGIPKENVIRHFDVTGKSCPAYWVDDAKWKAEFWNRLGSATVNSSATTTGTTNVPFLVKVDKVEKGDVLNIRKEPNANATKTGSLAYNDPNAYTIVEVKNGWGRLKSGIGWISLYYTKTFSGTATTVQTAQTVSPYYPKYTGNSYGIDTVFAAIGVPESMRGNYKNRRTIAKSNGISNYTGTAAQNTKLIQLAKQGVLKRP